MLTIDSILEDKGVEGFATSIGVRIGTVYVWKTRKSIPRRYWPEITKAHPELTLDRLLEAERHGATARDEALAKLRPDVAFQRTPELNGGGQ